MIAHEEYQYLNLVRHVIEHGERRPDRTGVGTRSQFGAHMRFSLANQTIPLLTTKRVFWKGIVEELLWIARGSTNAQLLADRGVHFWDANATREFLDNRGLINYPTGELGPVYGFQWRHFGADYNPIQNAVDTSYGHQREALGGVDQLSECARLIREEPDSRRIILSAWNPQQISQMALPPCHVLTQFYVSDLASNGKKRLSCHMYQRSGDLALGVPFNIASYSLLTHLMALWTDTEAHEFVYTIGDAHIYETHVETMREQLEREPRAFPTVQIAAPSNTPIFQIKPTDITLRGYTPHPPLTFSMAV